MNLDRLNNYLADDFTRLDAVIEQAIHSETRLTREVGEYLCSTPSKRLRPALVLLSSHACGHHGEEVIHLGASLELIHVATLLHDDVIDNAEMRRGRPSVNAQWGNNVSILMADFLYSKAFDLALSCLDPKALQIITHVTSRMCEGEMFQIQQDNRVLSVDDYFHIIRCKTANLFSACMSLGAVLADSNKDRVAFLADFGLNFGMAFQITDDTLDYTAQDSHWGKDVGTDVACGKFTLPLIRTLEVASPGDRESLMSSLNNGRDFSEILKQIHRYDGIRYSLGVARDFADRAQANLESLRPSEAASLIRWLADYVVERGF